MVNPSARQLFESIEAEHNALEATIQQQDQEIRSLKQQLSSLETAALARAEEQAANDRRVEQLAQQTAASTVTPEFFFTVLGCVRSCWSLSRELFATCIPCAATASTPKTDS
jgi:hypothetical protein